MVEIRIYVEGGGDEKYTRRIFREGMSQFLRRLTESLPNIKIECIPCGSRNETRRNFSIALKNHPEAINFLLVDAEDSVTVSSPKQHLVNRDGWDLTGVDDSQIHLMVESMENWLIADADTLAEYYRQGFNKNAIPSNNNVEEIPKKRVESILQRATANTQKKKYEKIRHGPKILELLDTSIVRRKAPYCDRLFQTIKKLVQKPDT